MATNKFEKTPEGVTKYLVGHDENGYMKKELTSSFARTDKIIKGDGINITFDPATNIVTVALDPDVATTIENSKIVDTLKDLAFKDKVALVDIDALGDRNSNTFLSGDGTFRTPAGAGDMTAAVYDPDGIAADAFSLGNMKETADAKKFTSVEKDKLDGIAVGATKNQTDAHLLDRQNHTGTQLLETISDAGELAALDNITMSKVTDAGTLATKNNITLAEITDAGLLAGKDKAEISDIDATGTPDLYSILFGDGTWRNLDYDGFLNYFINPNFDYWQRATENTFTNATGYVADRWACSAWGGATVSVKEQLFPLGYSNVPQSSRYMRLQVTNAGSATEGYVATFQLIENVRSLAGKKATITFYSRSDVEGNKCSVRVSQFFGQGTGASPRVDINAGIVELGTGQFQRHDVVVDIPSVNGKTLGTGSSWLGIQFLVSSNPNVAGGGDLGLQTGIFDFGRMSIVVGDQTKNPDPFYWRHPAIEITLVERYCQELTIGMYSYNQSANANAQSISFSFKTQMRDTPSAVDRAVLENTSTDTPVYTQLSQRGGKYMWRSTVGTSTTGRMVVARFESELF